MLCSRHPLSCHQPSGMLPGTALAVSACHQLVWSICGRAWSVTGYALCPAVAASDRGAPHRFRDVLGVLQRNQPVQGLVDKHGMLFHIVAEIETNSGRLGLRCGCCSAALHTAASSTWLRNRQQHAGARTRNSLDLLRYSRRLVGCGRLAVKPWSFAASTDTRLSHPLERAPSRDRHCIAAASSTHQSQRGREECCNRSCIADEPTDTQKSAPRAAQSPSLASLQRDELRSRMPSMTYGRAGDGHVILLRESYSRLWQHCGVQAGARDSGWLAGLASVSVAAGSASSL